MARNMTGARGVLQMRGGGPLLEKMLDSFQLRDAPKQSPSVRNIVLALERHIEGMLTEDAIAARDTAIENAPDSSKTGTKTDPRFAWARAKYPNDWQQLQAAIYAELLAPTPKTYQVQIGVNIAEAPHGPWLEHGTGVWGKYNSAYRWPSAPFNRPGGGQGWAYGHKAANNNQGFIGPAIKKHEKLARENAKKKGLQLRILLNESPPNVYNRSRKIGRKMYPNAGYRLQG